MAAAANALGPWHGPHEEHAKLSFCLCLAEISGLIVLPWVFPSITVMRHPWLSYTRQLPISPGFLVLLDCLGLSFAAVFISIYRRISARIAEGAADSTFLDRVRLSMASMTNFGVILLILIVTRMR